MSGPAFYTQDAICWTYPRLCAAFFIADKTQHKNMLKHVKTFKSNLSRHVEDSVQKKQSRQIYQTAFYKTLSESMNAHVS